MMTNYLHTSSAFAEPKRLGAILGRDLPDPDIVGRKKKHRETDHTRYNVLSRLDTHLPPAPHDLSSNSVDNLPPQSPQSSSPLPGTKFPEDKRPPEVRPLPAYVIREFNETMRSLNPDDPQERRWLSLGKSIVERYEELQNNPWDGEVQ